MAIVQNTFNDAPVAGFPGMVRNGEQGNRLSRTVEDVAGLAFGMPAYRGAGDHGVTGTPSANFMGWAVVDHGVQPLPSGVAADIYPQNSTAGLQTDGSVYVTAAVAVADGDPVYVTPGKAITNVNGGGANFDTGWKFDETIAAAGLVGIARR